MGLRDVGVSWQHIATATGCTSIRDFCTRPPGGRDAYAGIGIAKVAEVERFIAFMYWEINAIAEDEDEDDDGDEEEEEESCGRMEIDIDAHTIRMNVDVDRDCRSLCYILDQLGLALHDEFVEHAKEGGVTHSDGYASMLGARAQTRGTLLGNMYPPLVHFIQALAIDRKYLADEEEEEGKWLRTKMAADNKEGQMAIEDMKPALIQVCSNLALLAWPRKIPLWHMLLGTVVNQMTHCEKVMQVLRATSTTCSYETVAKMRKTAAGKRITAMFNEVWAAKRTGGGLTLVELIKCYEDGLRDDYTPPFKDEHTGVGNDNYQDGAGASRNRPGVHLWCETKCSGIVWRLPVFNLDGLCVDCAVVLKAHREGQIPSRQRREGQIPLPQISASQFYLGSDQGLQAHSPEATRAYYRRTIAADVAALITPASTARVLEELAAQECARQGAGAGGGGNTPAPPATWTEANHAAFTCEQTKQQGFFSCMLVLEQELSHDQLAAGGGGGGGSWENERRVLHKLLFALSAAAGNPTYISVPATEGLNPPHNVLNTDDLARFYSSPGGARVLETLQRGELARWFYALLTEQGLSVTGVTQNAQGPPMFQFTPLEAEPYDADAVQQLAQRERGRGGAGRGARGGGKRPAPGEGAESSKRRRQAAPASDDMAEFVENRAPDDTPPPTAVGGSVYLRMDPAEIEEGEDRRGNARYGIGRSWRDNTAAVPQGESLVGRWVLYNRGRALGWQNAKVLRVTGPLTGRSSKYVVRLEDAVADSGLELEVYLRQDQHSEIGSWLLWSDFDADGRRPRWYIRTRGAPACSAEHRARARRLARSTGRHTPRTRSPRLAGAGAGEEEGTSEEEADGAEADGPNAQ
jgi:hypothetical protein